MSDTAGFRRAMVMMTASSMMVPVFGILTAPILAQALGVAGRGEAAAAVAPNLLVVSVATLGLPEALTYFLAKRPGRTRAALWWASLFSALLGAVCFVVVYFAASFLSGNDTELSDLMILGTAIAIPALFVNLLRGAASGRQMWSAVASERILNSVIRLGALGALALTGQLDVLNAVLVMTIGPVVAGLVYWKLFLRPPATPAENDDTAPIAPALMSFGSKIWLGAVASMLMARLSQLLMTPLSNTEQLGLLVVAITISDVPFIVAQTVRDVIFGSDSAQSNPARLASTARMATLIAFAGSLVLGVSLPFWIAPLFGAGFEGSIVPTWLLLANAVVGVPGLIAGAGLASSGRPGLRSMALLISLVLNFVGLVLLAPLIGAVGAALAALIGTIVSTVFGVVMVSKLVEVPMSSFVMPRRTDVVFLWAEGRMLVARLGRRRGR